MVPGDAVLAQVADEILDVRRSFPGGSPRARRPLGLRSRTRTLIDAGAPRARHVGLLNTGGFADGVKVPGRPGTSSFVFGGKCFFGYLIHPDGQVWWFANPPSPREPSPEKLAAMIMRRMTRKNSLAWMHDHRISWDEPVSPTATR